MRLPFRLALWTAFYLSVMHASAQTDAGVNLAGALISRAVVLVEFPLDTVGTWSLEVGAFYGRRPTLREPGTGRVVTRESDVGLVADLRRYLRAGGRTGIFLGPWLRYHRSGRDDRRPLPIAEERRQTYSLGVLVGYKHATANRIFIEPCVGAGTVVVNLVKPLGFGGDDIFPLTGDYVFRLRAGYRF